MNCITLDSVGDSASSLCHTHSTSFEDDSSDNFEVSEEMIQFMEINMRHRAGLGELDATLTASEVMSQLLVVILLIHS